MTATVSTATLPLEDYKVTLIAYGGYETISHHRASSPAEALERARWYQGANWPPKSVLRLNGARWEPCTLEALNAR